MVSYVRITGIKFREYLLSFDCIETPLPIGF